MQETVFSKDEHMLNEWQKMFFADQVRNATSRSNRYHPDVIRWAIELYCRSPAAYEHIRSSVLTLPCARTIRNYRNYLTPKPGLNPAAVAEIERVAAKGEVLDGYITLDEMKIRENIVVKEGKLVGFVESDLTAECQLATHILVYYLRTIKREVSLPLAWFPTTVTPAAQLAINFWDLLGECETRGVQVHAVVADGLSTNRKFFKLLGGKKSGPIPLDKPFVANNPYALERPIFLLSDPSHLLKTARNSLESSKPGGKKFMNCNGKIILWTHISELYKLEMSTPSLSRTRLTEAHIKLNPHSKMKVNLARQVLSWEVGQCLKTIPGAEGTSDYVLMMAKWFDIANCNNKDPIREMDDERLQWLRDFVAKLLSWKTDVEQLGESKRLMALPTLEGLVFTSLNLIGLCERLLQRNSYVCLHTFTQDVLEAFFGNLRQLGRRSQNPDIAQAAYGIHQITQRKVIKKVKGGNTTFGSENAWTSVCDEPMPKL